MSFLRSKKAASVAAALLIVIYIGVLSYLSIVRYLSLNSHYYDLGIMDQVVFNTSQGRILRMTDPEIAQNTSRFSVHFDPLLITLAPIYMIVASPIVLLIAQTVVLGLGGWAVFLIAKRVLKHSWYAVLFVFLYLNFYPLQLANLFDFHVVTFATTTLLYAFYFLMLQPVRRRWVNYATGAAFLLVTLFAKENATLVIACMCTYLYYAKKRSKFYLGAALLCGIFFLMIVFHVIPFYRSASSFALSYFDIHHPLVLLKRLFSTDSWAYIVRLLVPFGYLPLLAPLTFLIAAPELLINLISANSNMRELHFHYTAMITPFLIISTIYGFAKIREYVFNSPKLMRATVALLILVSMWTNISVGTFTYPVGKIDKVILGEIYYWRNRLKNQRILISTTGTIAPFFTEHQRFYYFLFDPAYKNMGKTDTDMVKLINNYKKADYVIIREADVAGSDPLVTKYYDQLKNDTDFSKVSDQNGIEVYSNITRL